MLAYEGKDPLPVPKTIILSLVMNVPKTLTLLQEITSGTIGSGIVSNSHCP